MHDGTHTHGHKQADEAHTHNHKAPEATHGHNHTEIGSDNISASKSGMDKDKLTALLTYMKEHNHEHANELHNLLYAIQELGADEIADIIENSAEAIEAAATGIENALELLAEI